MLLPRETDILAPKSLTDALEICFREFGDSVAIDTSGFRMTYAELDGMTRHVASELRTRCSQQQLKSKPIAILMSRSVELYVAQIAVLRAGGFFLPIDPSQPAERIEFLLSDSCSSLLLVREEDSFTAGDSTVVPLSINVNRWAEEQSVRASYSSTAVADEMDLCSQVGENDFAYMIYTSGSTGKPKGVAIAHRSICNLCHWWSDKFERSHGQRTLQMMSVGFDASLEEIFTTLVTGGTLVPIQAEAMNSMEQFLDFIGRKNVQNLHLPTAFWHVLSASFSTHESLKLPASVRTIVLGGEKIDSTLVESWFDKVGTEVRLINAYGPTETTVAASYSILRPGVRPSIGRPIRGVSFCVCDKNGHLVEAGQSGELYIGGVGVAKGYWERSKLSAEKFVASPCEDDLPYYRTGDLVRLNEDGNYEFVGRVDDQIKLRGYRIEPGEISNCLGTHPQVTQAHVMGRQLSNENSAQQLIGYVVAEPGDHIGESELREFLSRHLPAYMVPIRIVMMESFPITTGGKLDLAMFPCPTVDAVSRTDQESGARFLTPTEQKIGKVWEKVLGRGRLDREANFFEIGGDSLSALRLLLLLESEFPGPVIPIAALIPNPTIAAMADYIDHRQSESPAEVPQNWPLLTRLAGQQPIRVACVHGAGGGGMFYRQLFEELKQTTPVAVLESAILYQETSVAYEDLNIADIARGYVDCLIDAGCEQKLTLVGYSFGSLVAFEMAPLLKARGYVVEKIINIDCPNPQKMKRRNRLSRFWCRLRSHGTIDGRFTEYKLIMQRKQRIKELKKCKIAKRSPPVELRPLALELIFGALAEKYVPRQLDIEMYLIKGEYPEATYHIPGDYGWTGTVSAFTKVEIPGGHNTIFYQPYLKSLIKAFHEAWGK